MSEPQHIDSSLGSYQRAADAALAAMSESAVMARIWAHDHTVWKPDPAEITNRLGWLTTASAMAAAMTADLFMRITFPISQELPAGSIGPPRGHSELSGGMLVVEVRHEPGTFLRRPGRQCPTGPVRPDASGKVKVLAAPNYPI